MEEPREATKNEEVIENKQNSTEEEEIIPRPLEKSPSAPSPSRHKEFPRTKRFYNKKLIDQEQLEGLESKDQKEKEKSEKRMLTAADLVLSPLFYKLCLVGMSKVGKSTLIHRFMTGQYNDQQAIQPPKTENVQIAQSCHTRKIRVRDENVFVEVLDTLGDQKSYQAKCKKWFEWGEGFMLLYDVAVPASFEYIPKFKKHIEKSKQSSDIPFLIVGAKCDDAQRKVSRDQGSELARTLNCQFIEVSAKTGERVEQAFQTLAAAIRAAREKRGEPVSVIVPLSKTEGENGEFEERKKRSSSMDGTRESLPKRLYRRTILRSTSSSYDDLDIESTKPIENNRPIERRGEPSAYNKAENRKSANKIKKRLTAYLPGFLGAKDAPDDLVLNEANNSLESIFKRTISEVKIDFWTTKEFLPRQWNGVEAPPQTSEQPDIHATVDTTCAKEGIHCEIGRSSIVYGSEVAIEHNVKDIPFYQIYFSDVEHVNLVSDGEDDKSVGPVCITFRAPSKDDPEDKKGLLRTKKGTERFIIPLSYCTSVMDMTKYVRRIFPYLAQMKLVEIADPDFNLELHKYEKQEIITTYKFGVIYMKDGQKDEDSIFGNANTTGTHSVYTKFNNFEIMFHVSTLLPFQPDDKQHLERKRHIGNDIVVIVFKEGKTPFNPLWIKSHFNHVFAVVQVEKKVRGETFYRVNFASKPGVVPFGPFLPHPPVFTKGEEFRNFFLTKLINAERATMFAPDFHDKLERTRKELLHEMARTWIPKAKGVVKRGKSTMLVDREPKETPETHSPPPPSTEEVAKTENGTTSPHPPPVHLSSSPTSGGEAWTKELMLLKDKLKGKLNKEKMSIRKYCTKIVAFGKRLHEWSECKIEQFDGVEFLFLTNQLVQTVIIDASYISNTTHRHIIVDHAKNLVGYSALFLAFQEARKRHTYFDDTSSDYSDKSDDSEARVSDAKKGFEAALTKLLVSVEAATKHQEKTEKAITKSSSNELTMEQLEEEIMKKKEEREEEARRKKEKSEKKKLEKKKLEEEKREEKRRLDEEKRRQEEEKKRIEKEKKEEKKKMKSDKKKYSPDDKKPSKEEDVPKESPKESPKKSPKEPPTIQKVPTPPVKQTTMQKAPSKARISAESSESETDSAPPEVKLTLKEVHTVAERMALKLVQVLSPAEIDDEEFAEVLRALGQVARTGYEIILMERLDKEQGKKITSCTQSLLKLGVEYKKNPECDSPSFRKEVLAATNLLLTVLKESSVEQELSTLLAS